MGGEVFQVEAEHLGQPLVMCIFRNDEFGSLRYRAVGTEFVGHETAPMVRSQFVVPSSQRIIYLCFDRLPKVQTLRDAEQVRLA